MFSSAENNVWRTGVKVLGGLEHGLRAEGGPGAVAGEDGLDLTDECLGGSLGNQIDLNRELERLLEERGSGNSGYVLDALAAVAAADLVFIPP